MPAGWAEAETLAYGAACGTGAAGGIADTRHRPGRPGEERGIQAIRWRTDHTISKSGRLGVTDQSVEDCPPDNHRFVLQVDRDDRPVRQAPHLRHGRRRCLPGLERRRDRPHVGNRGPQRPHRGLVVASADLQVEITTRISQIGDRAPGDPHGHALEDTEPRLPL